MPKKKPIVLIPPGLPPDEHDERVLALLLSLCEDGVQFVTTLQDRERCLGQPDARRRPGPTEPVGALCRASGWRPGVSLIDGAATAVSVPPRYVWGLTDGFDGDVDDALDDDDYARGAAVGAALREVVLDEAGLADPARESDPPGTGCSEMVENSADGAAELGGEA